MTRSVRLVADPREPSGGCSAFCAAIPALVDGGAHVVAVHRYCPANEDGPASATVLVHWGDDGELPEWGTHVLSPEPDLGRHLLWDARYFTSLDAAWADLRERMPAWQVVDDGAIAVPGRRRTPARPTGARCGRRRCDGRPPTG